MIYQQKVLIMTEVIYETASIYKKTELTSG
jgi:hypothetical protein